MPQIQPVTPDNESPGIEDQAPPITPDMSHEQYTGIKSGVGFVRMVPWPPAPEQWVGMRALSRGELEQAFMTALEFSSKFKRGEDQTVLTKAREDSILWYALRNRVAIEQPDGSLRQVVDKPQEHLFTSPDDFRRCVDDEQAKKLLALYDEHCQTTTPLTRAQSLLRDQEYEVLTRQLKKKPDAIELTACLLTDVLAYLNFLLERVPSSAEPAI